MQYYAPRNLLSQLDARLRNGLSLRGEEFIIIVKAANDEEACRAGVRICQLVDNHAITHSEGHINITVTAGVSRAFPEEPLDVVIGRADRAMYEGKQTGRNRCMFIDEQNVINRV